MTKADLNGRLFSVVFVNLCEINASVIGAQSDAECVNAKPSP